MTQETSEIVEAGQGGALAVREDYMPVLSVDQMLARYENTVAFCKKLMKEGRDYGTIPGTERKGKDGELSSKNNTLFKPGAEKLCTFFGLTPDFQDYRVVEDWNAGLFYYAFKCVISSRAGVVVATGIGSCNSREKKYCQLARRCPECNSAALKRSKFPPRDRPKATPGWYCDGGKGGCGLQFDADDDRIMGQEVTVDVSAAADKINTIQKMAQKRAMIAAVLTATNASEFFTQDMEDLDPEGADAGDHGAAAARAEAEAEAQKKAEEEKRAAERAQDAKDKPGLVAAVVDLAEQIYGAEFQNRIAEVLANVGEQAGHEVATVADCPTKILRSWKGTLEKKKAAAAAAGVARPLDAPPVPEKPETAKKRQAAAKDAINKAAAIEAIKKLTAELYGDRADDMISDTVANWAQEHGQPFFDLSDCPTKGLEEWAELLKAAAKKAK